MTLSFPTNAFEFETWNDASNEGTITRIGFSSQKTTALAMQDLTNAGYTIGVAHPTQTTYRLRSRNVTPLSVGETVPSGTATRHFRVTLEYANTVPSGVATGDEIWTIQIQNQSIKINSVDGYQTVNGVATVAPQIHYPANRNCGAAIGVNSDGETEGTDAYRPTMTLTCQKTYAAFHDGDSGGIPWTTIKAFSYPKPCYNSAAMNWHGMAFGVGELLFLGASATKQDGKWVVTYQFIASPWSSYTVSFLDSKEVVDGETTLVFDTATVGVSGCDLTAMPFDCVWPSIYETVNNDTGTKQKWLAGLHAAKIYNAADLKLLLLNGPDGLAS